MTGVAGSEAATDADGLGRTLLNLPGFVPLAPYVDDIRSGSTSTRQLPFGEQPSLEMSPGSPSTEFGKMCNTTTTCLVASAMASTRQEDPCCATASDAYRDFEKPLRKYHGGRRLTESLLSGHWCWMHKSGWRKYEDNAQMVIEKAYRAGDSKARLKTGKSKTSPMEVFFQVDPGGGKSIQFDPTTGGARQVMRQGKVTWSLRAERYFNGIWKWMETGKPRRQMFDEYQKRREQLTEDIATTTDVRDKYHENSWCSFVASSSSFFGSTMLVVVLNVLWIAVDLDTNKEEIIITDAEVHVQVIENIFCAFFLGELAVRFGAFRLKRDCLKERWFVFDFFLVVFSVAETWVFPLLVYISKSNEKSGLQNLTFVRMIRLLRLTKLFRLFPQLLTMVKGFTAAIPSVLVTVLMLLILTLVFSLLLRGQFKGVEELSRRWGNVPKCAWSLLVYGVFLDNPGDVMDEMWEQGFAIMSGVFVVYIFLSTFLVLNMLIGILCEVVGKVAAHEKDEAEARFLQQNLLVILSCYDKDGDEFLGEKEFDMVMANPEVVELLETFGTDPKGLVTLKEVLFEGSKNHRLSFGEVLNTVMRLRSENNAKIMDLIDLRWYVQTRFDELALAGSPKLSPRQRSQGAQGVSNGPAVCALAPKDGVDEVVESKTAPSKMPQPWDLVLSRLNEMSEAQAAEARIVRERLDRLEESVRRIAVGLPRRGATM